MTGFYSLSPSKGKFLGFVISREFHGQSYALGWWSEGRRSYPGRKGIKGYGCRAWTRERKERNGSGELLKKASKDLGSLQKHCSAYCSFSAQSLAMIAPHMLYWVRACRWEGKKSLRCDWKAWPWCWWQRFGNNRAEAGTRGKMTCPDWISWRGHQLLSPPVSVLPVTYTSVTSLSFLQLHQGVFLFLLSFQLNILVFEKSTGTFMLLRKIPRKIQKFGQHLLWELNQTICPVNREGHSVLSEFFSCP